MLVKDLNKSLRGQFHLFLYFCALLSAFSCSAAVLYEDFFSTDTTGNYEADWYQNHLYGAWTYDGTAKTMNYSTTSGDWGTGVFVTKTSIFDNDFSNGDHYRISAKISFNTETAYHAGLVFGVDTVSNEAYALVVNNHWIHLGRLKIDYPDMQPGFYSPLKNYSGSYPGVDTLYFTVDVVKNGSTTVMNASVFDGSNTYEGSYTDNSVTFGGGQIGFWGREDTVNPLIYSYDNLLFQTIDVPEPSVIGLLGIALLLLRKRLFTQIQNA